MNCHDTRELLSGLVDGVLTPDEQRRVEAHLADCADCRKEHERLSATIALLRQMERPRAPVGFVDRVLAAAQPVPWHRRWLGRLFLPLSVKLPAEAAALLLVGGLAVFVFQRTPELQQAARQAPAPPTAREPAAPVAAAPPPPVATSRPARVAVSPPPPVATSPSANELLSARARSRDEGSSDQAKGKTAEAPERTSEGPERLRLARDSRTPEPAAKVAPASPDVSTQTSQPNDELKDALKKETVGAPKSAGAARPPAFAAPQPPPAPAVERRADSPREKAAQAPAAAPAPPRSAMRVLPSGEVMGRLAVKDLDAAEHALADLLARSGGVVTSRREDAGTIVMEVAVPKPAYADFTAGLTRIGAWQSDGEPSESAASVRVTLRLVP